jgi:4-hydroxy-4-methyl-2-oxoglutarate aldolase
VSQLTSKAASSPIADWKPSAQRLRTALILDILDSKGLRSQALRPGIVPRTVQTTVIGSAKTLLWMDFAYDDPSTYALELEAVDSLQPDQFVVCATGNSQRSGIWGELLSTAALRRRAAGIVTDGGVRDIADVEAMGFPVFSRFISPYDSFNRQKVVAFDIRVEVDGVTIEPGDIIVADRDGVAVVPSKIAPEILASALGKAGKEDRFRESVKNGASLLEAYERFQIL